VVPEVESQPDDRSEVVRRVSARLVAGKVQVPMLPRVATEVMSLARSANASAAQLAALVHKDPALAARLLRVANSVAYSPAVPIVSLQQAITRMGIGTLTDLTMAASVKGLTFEDHLHLLWRTSLATAAFAKEIARSRRANVETAFLCGLLFGIGRPMVLQMAVEDVNAKSLDIKSPVVRAQILDAENVLQIDAGVFVAERWKLPPAVMASIRHHESPADAGEQQTDAATVGVAKILAANALAGDPPENPLVPSEQALSILNLYPDEIEGIVARKASILEMVNTMTA
jgi:HD-like signal output (HDOD) protein